MILIFNGIHKSKNNYNNIFILMDIIGHIIKSVLRIIQHQHLKKKKKSISLG